MSNRLNQDPTRTRILRQAFEREVRKRFNLLKRDITQLLVEEDAFGLLKKHRLSTFNSSGQPITNTRWSFLTNPDKVNAFKLWLEERIRDRILEVDPQFEQAPWLADYITSAYQKGVARAYVDANAQDLAPSPEFFGGSEAQFLIDTFASKQSVETLKLLATRSYDQLKGITEAMSQQISRELIDGVSQGKGPREIARKLNKAVTGVTKKRALTMARTEVIHAHAEGQLDSFEAQGIEEVGVYAEWLTARDKKVCKLCAALSGIVMRVKDARGLLPRHPNCRCAWMPADSAFRTTYQEWDNDKQKFVTRKQRWGRKEVQTAVFQSIRLERPRTTSLTQAVKESRWVGATRRIRKKKKKNKPIKT